MESLNHGYSCSLHIDGSADVDSNGLLYTLFVGANAQLIYADEGGSCLFADWNGVAEMVRVIVVTQTMSAFVMSAALIGAVGFPSNHGSTKTILSTNSTSKLECPSHRILPL